MRKRARARMQTALHFLIDGNDGTEQVPSIESRRKAVCRDRISDSFWVREGRRGGTRPLTPVKVIAQ
jgi:hypothetical protein